MAETFRPEITLVSEDARGEIYSISLPGDRELMLLHSVKGSIRGGHSHTCAEDVTLLKGRMLYSKRGLNEDSVKVLYEGGHSFNDSDEIHMAEFLEDSWVTEWKICKDKHSWKNTNYAPWREKVQNGIS